MESAQDRPAGFQTRSAPTGQQNIRHSQNGARRSAEAAAANVLLTLFGTRRSTKLCSEMLLT